MGVLGNNSVIVICFGLLRPAACSAFSLLAFPVRFVSTSGTLTSRLDLSTCSGSLDTSASNDETSISDTVAARWASSVPPICATQSPTLRGPETVITSSMAVAKSRAVWNRVLAFRSRAFMTTRSKSGDTRLLMKLGRGILALITLATTPPGSSAWKRGFVASASQRTIPAAKMSTRRSMSPEPICSGAI